MQKIVLVFGVLKNIAKMYTSLSAVFIFVFVQLVASNLVEHRLPDVFEIDDYASCMSENNVYCKYKLKFKSSRPDDASETWIRIMEMRNKRIYSRENLYVGVCFNDKRHNISKLIYSYKNKYQRYGMEIESVNQVSCQEISKFTLDQTDVILTFIIIAYIITVLYATIADCKNTAEEKTIGNTLVLFSIKHSMQQLLKPQKVKIKCIEGIRVGTMFAIIFCHTYGSYLAAYLKNTEFVENLSTNIMKFIPFQNLLFLVQTFFLISGWLLSYQVYEYFEKHNKKFNLKDVLNMFIKRYLRLIPVVVAMIIFHSLKYTTSNRLGVFKEIFSEENDRCRKNYWLTVFFLSNFIPPGQICNLGTWYLTADVQLYLFSLLILFVCLKFPKYENVILATVLTVVVTLMSIIIFVNNLDVCYTIFPRDTAVDNVFSSKEFLYLYYSTSSNAASYIVGIIFGKLFFKTQIKNVKLFPDSNVFGCLFFGLPVLAIIACFYDYTLIIRSILGAIIKPMYALGIAIGIQWMGQGGGGIIKKLCECDLVMMLSNFSYSTYIFHIGFVFSRTAFTQQLLDLTSYNLLKSYVFDVIVSLISGIAMHVFVEIPGMGFRKYLIVKMDQKVNGDKLKTKQQ